MRVYCAWGGVLIGSPTAGGSEGGGVPVDEGSTIDISIGCDENGVYAVFEEAEEA